MHGIAESFWRNKTFKDYVSLSHQWNINQKLSYDIENLLPYVRDSKSVGDISCGDGRILNILNGILNFEDVYLSDINERLVYNALQINDDALGTVCNLNSSLPNFVRKSDTILLLGTMHYIIDDNRLKQIFEDLRDTKLIIRVPCRLDGELHFNGYSKEFGEHYEAKYRTPVDVCYMLSLFFKNIESKLIYPESLESKYGSKQYLFVCQNGRKNDSDS